MADCDGFHTGFEVVSTDTNLTHEQISAEGRRLIHYSMDEYFYPRLIVTFVPSHTGKAQVHQRASWSWPQAAILALLSITSLFLFISLRQTQAQLSEALRSVNSIPRDPPAGIPGSVYHEVVETITITSTATVVAGANPTRWYSHNPGSSDSRGAQASSIAPDEAAAPPPSPPLDNLTPTRTAQIPTITPTPLGASDGENSISRYLPIVWQLRLEFPNIHFPKSANETLQSVLASFDTVYQLFRRVYHYPLAPP